MAINSALSQKMTLFMNNRLGWNYSECIIFVYYNHI